MRLTCALLIHWAPVFISLRGENVPSACSGVVALILVTYCRSDVDCYDGIQARFLHLNEGYSVGFGKWVQEAGVYLIHR